MTRTFLLFAALLMLGSACDMGSDTTSSATGGNPQAPPAPGAQNGPMVQTNPNGPIVCQAEGSTANVNYSAVCRSGVAGVTCVCSRNGQMVNTCSQPNGDCNTTVINSSVTAACCRF